MYVVFACIGSVLLCFCVEVRRALARTSHRVFSKREYQSNPDFRMSRGIVDIKRLI